MCLARVEDSLPHLCLLFGEEIPATVCLWACSWTWLWEPRSVGPGPLAQHSVCQPLGCVLSSDLRGYRVR